MISIIIVNYHVKKELFACLESIFTSKQKSAFEIIVVDNDEKKDISTDLQKRFTKIQYIPNENRGFGQANNIGAKKAKGEYLFFLNPDTVLEKGTVDTLANYLNKHENVGIVVPLLLGENGKPYQQGSQALTPLEGIVCLSFLNSLFPQNPVSKKYFLHDWERNTVKEVDVVPGTAMMIKKSLFDKVGGFDDRFFLFFEEFDLCKRIKKLGYTFFIIPQVRVKHLWGVSVKQRKDVKSTFSKSRFLYFEKHYGIFWAFLVQAVTSFSKTFLLLLCILSLSLFLNIYRLSELMTFIGDQGWFYLSARDMVLTGNIPLVGIASSHPWLHQGPLWTYILGINLWFFHFNPVSGANLTAIIGVVSVYVLFLVARDMFSERVGIIAAILYATSPLVINNARFAYHTSPIPFFVILFLWCIYKWIEGSRMYFPLALFLLSILYNLELATASMFFIVIFFLIYGKWKKTVWFRELINKKVIILSIVAFLIPMIPILTYDVLHGFRQTAGFAAWIIYKTLKTTFSIGENVMRAQIAGENLLTFISDNIQRLLFMPSNIVSLVLFVMSVGFFIGQIFQMHQKKIYNVSYIVLFFCFLIPAIGFFIAHTASDAYLPLFFPIIILIVSIFFEFLVKKSKYFFLVIILMAFLNCYMLLRNNYSFTSGKTLTMEKRINAVKSILKLVNGEEYNLIGRGSAGTYQSGVMNYRYLLWLFGKEPLEKKTTKKIYINEDNSTILVEKDIILMKK